MTRTGSAVWHGGLMDGKGTVSTEAGVLSNTPYSFSSRFEHGTGTNPEELLGAAHAGCFSMALSAVLGESHITVESIETSAAVTVEKVGDGFSITSVALKTAVSAPGADKEKVEAAILGAKAGCPVSKLFNTTITIESTVNV